MTKTTRYLLIAIGFIIFFILAPLLVLYVRGIHYDFKNHTFVSTGIIAIQTDPKTADIFINDQLARTSSGDIKFLEPGDYTVTVKKDGYFDWNKRLTVKENQVTWASPVPNQLHLYLSNQPAVDIVSGISNFQIVGNQLATLAANALSISPLSNPNQSQNIAIAKPVDSIISSPDQNTILLTGSQPPSAHTASTTPVVLMYSVGSQQLTDISGLFAGKPELKYADNGTLYDLENGTLYSVDVSRLQKKQLLTNIKTFTLLQNDLYLVRPDGASWSLYAANGSGGNMQKLVSDLPPFQTGKILANFEKQIFVLADGTMYKINATADRIADNVSGEYFDPSNEALLIIHGGEVDNYNFQNQRFDFVTRSSSLITNPILQQNMSFAFLGEDNSLIGLELDLRDHQNTYTFYQGKNLQKFILDPNARTLYVLDDGNLKSIKIR